MYTYRFDQSYDFNYEEGPRPLAVPVRPPAPSAISIPGLGIKVRSRLGVFSGPLLNSQWVELYARLGFDVLAYKTVRSVSWPSHPWPNCAYIPHRGQLAPHLPDRPAALTATVEWPGDAPVVSMTNSYGMPSRPPVVWMRDVSRARASLEEGQLLIVSVVGRDLEDYATTARLAREAGAAAVEINLSCPNVVTCEGSIYTDPVTSRDLCRLVRQSLSDTPLIIKVGYIESDALLHALLESVAPYVQGVSGINTVPMTILGAEGAPLLGEGRAVAGVCGDVIRTCGLDFARRLCDWRRRHGAAFGVLAGGGIMTPEHVDQYLAAGVDVAMVATAALTNPTLAWQHHTHSAPVVVR